jgi:heme/copper-type cytochrome/quinol oxidase subunit 2
MNFIAFMTMIILVVSIFTLVFGVIAYFLYKARERNRKSNSVSYEDILNEYKQEYIFFE